MKKLYFPKAQPEHYWEYWDSGDGSYIVHWGMLGTEGESKTVQRRLLNSAKSEVEKLERDFVSKGYEEIAMEDHKVLLIEYAVEGFGNEDDLLKRHKLEEMMNEVLGWSGLGHCDGGSIGSGTMEVCCFVVNFETAQRVISEKLTDTDFSDYSRIYQED